MASAHDYARRRIINADAAQDVVRELGEDTFSSRALPIGVDRKAPLDRFSTAASIASLGEGVRSFRRWGFEVGQAAKPASPLARAR